MRFTWQSFSCIVGDTDRRVGEGRETMPKKSTKKTPKTPKKAGKAKAKTSAVAKQRSAQPTA